MLMYLNYRWFNIGLLNKYKEIYVIYWELIIKREVYEKVM